jgi:hypothetical protein
LRNNISVGAFWCLRKDFEAIGGFNESLVSAEDVDFAKRLRVYGKVQKKKYGTIFPDGIITSARKWDIFGSWRVLQKLPKVFRILSGKDQEVADEYYYEARCELNESMKK